mmetsp:Transcript_52051/g.167474  ORF Transcript_52051/g.167474 Transcript_52051/m.167474 type:complete len:280 (+) Transcript_52051:379-1218(+)
MGLGYAALDGWAISKRTTPLGNVKGGPTLSTISPCANTRTSTLSKCSVAKTAKLSLVTRHFCGTKPFGRGGAESDRGITPRNPSIGTLAAVATADCGTGRSSKAGGSIAFACVSCGAGASAAADAGAWKCHLEAAALSAEVAWPPGCAASTAANRRGAGPTPDATAGRGGGTPPADGRRGRGGGARKEPVASPRREGDGARAERAEARGGLHTAPAASARRQRDAVGRGCCRSGCHHRSRGRRGRHCRRSASTGACRCADCSRGGNSGGVGRGVHHSPR